MVELFRGRHWDLVGHRRWFYLFSICLVGAGVATWFSNVKSYGLARSMNVGIDFTGGAVYTIRLPKPIQPAGQAAATAQIRSALRRELKGRFEVQLSVIGLHDYRNLVLVRTQTTEESGRGALDQEADAIRSTLDKLFPGVARRNRSVDREVVGAAVSKDLISKGIAAAILGSFFILIWITIRYEFKYAICAIIALIHDIMTLLGSFAIVYRLGWGGQVDSAFVAAVLTVLGYSVHDTVVIFDRIRENVKLRKRPTFPETVNTSLLETMARSVNTVLTLELTLLAIFFLGGPTLRDFSLAMLIGVTIGAYSSIFNASQVLVGWKIREGRTRAPARVPTVAAPTRMPKLTRTVTAAPTAAASDAPRPATSEATAELTTSPTEPTPSARRKPPRAGKRKRRY